jgi:hypothetical protein
MRGMNRFYHERFFSDVRFTSAAALALFVAGMWQIPQAYLLIPPLTLLGATQTAFDASYLIFSRHYARAIEHHLNAQADAKVLVAHEMEDRYLFPLDKKKIVTARFGSDFSWFGFMTLLYTALGVLAFGFSLALGWETLMEAGDAWPIAYLGSLGLLVAVSLGVGWWWFVSGTGEERLSRVLSSATWSERPTQEST